MFSGVSSVLPRQLPVSSRILVPVCTIGAVCGLMYTILGAKQRSRPDPIIDTFKEAVPVVKQRLMEMAWNILLTSRKNLGLDNSRAVNNVISGLHQLQLVEDSAFKDKKYELNSDTNDLVELISKPLTERDFIKFNSYISYSGDPTELWKALKGYKDLLLPLDESYFKEITRKISEITKFSKTDGTGEFKPEDQLTVSEVRLLMNASLRRKVLDCLKEAGIKFPNDYWLRNEWAKLENLYNTGVMKEIVDRCHQGFKPGMVYFYDWCIIEIRNFYRVGLTDLARRLIDGRIPHITIVVESEKELMTSHVNSAMGQHGFHPIKGGGLILGALGYFVKLEINSLLSPQISSEHRNELQKIFDDEFVKIANEPHPEIKLKDSDLAIRMGVHKGLEAHDLKDVELKGPQICSSYVGIVFLKAIQAVNERIMSFGYDEKNLISHPFGEHEILDRIDILRLIYHWKRLNVMKVVPIDFFVSKVIAGPKMS